MKRIFPVLVAVTTLIAADEAIAPLGTYTAVERRHWAFQPRKAVKPPVFMLAADKAWVKTPIDAFILEQLKKSD